MRIILTGGGTGGHVIPNIAVIEELNKHSAKADILYIGSKKGIEKDLVEKLDLHKIPAYAGMTNRAGMTVMFKGISCGKLRRYFSFENFVDFFRIPLGVAEARKIMKKFQPDVVFSKGGFVSFPVVVAAYFLKIPVIIHESDVTPGLANCMSFRFANKICLSFEKTKQYIKAKDQGKLVVTGTPVRSSILNGDKKAGLEFLELNSEKPIILIMGGSQGAEQINELVLASMDELLKKFQIVHITGKGKQNISLNKKGYVQYEYLDAELKDVYAACDLIVSRGGANSLAEIAALDKKAVVLPLCGPGSRGDQIENAKIFDWPVLQGKVSREEFISAIKNVEKIPASAGMTGAGMTGASCSQMKNGSKEIVKLILSNSIKS